MILLVGDSVQKPINDDTRHRDVKPDGERDPRPALMGLKTSGKSMAEGLIDQRDLDRRQDRMRDQDGKIKSPAPALPRKTCGAVRGMIVKITDKKQGRGDRRGEHAKFVGSNGTITDEYVAEDQQDRARQI